MRLHHPALRFWLPPWIWMGLIFSASGDGASSAHTSMFFEPLMRWLFPLMTQDRMDELHYLVRKCAHLTEFAILALLWWRAVGQTTLRAASQWRWSQAGFALAAVVIYAASDELHQAFVPGRTARLADVGVDAAGGLMGMGLLWLAGKITRRW